MDIKHLDIRRIQQAFSPAQEILDPQLFVGRRLEIEDGMRALLNAGGFLSIFGLRGVGKSSIAYQIKLIAEGDKTLPGFFGIEKLIPHKGFNFLVHYIRSDGFVKNIPDLMRRIIFGDDRNQSLFSLTNAGERQLTEFKRILEAEGGIGVFGAKVGAKGTEHKTYREYVSDDIIQQFRKLLGTVHKDNQTRSGFLILVDEFDTIPDKSGFASIVKTCSTEFIRFGVIGIATSVTELIEDHASIGRQIDTIHVPLMPDSELRHILRRAQYKVDDAIVFDDSAVVQIAEQAQGFPYFVHLLGREAMLMAFMANSQRVLPQHIRALAKKINDGRLSTIYEDIYQDAVKHSPYREILLKLFSEQDSDEIATAPVYATAKEFGITNPSQLMKELTHQENRAGVLTKVRERYFRFTDPVFKVYARMRNWKY